MLYWQVLAVVRGYDQILKFCRYQDDHTRVWFTLLSSLRWLGLRLDFLCVCFTTVVVFAALAVDSGAGM